MRTPSGIAYAVATRERCGAHSRRPRACACRSTPPSRAARRRAARRRARAGRRRAVRRAAQRRPANSALWEHARSRAALGLPLVPPSSPRYAAARLYALPDGARSASTSSTGAPTRTACRRRGGRRASASCCSSRARRDARVRQRASAPASPTTSSPTPTSRTWSASTSARSRCCAPCRRSTSATPECSSRSLDRLDELVIKPRNGHGGHGVVIAPHARAGGARARRREARAPRRSGSSPRRWSRSRRHPTVVDGRLEPRHVDLRPFVVPRPASTRRAARRAHARRARRRRAGRQLLAERRRQGHLGARVSGAAADRGHDLGGPRSPSDVDQRRARRARRRPRWRSGMTYVRAIERAGGVPVVLPPLATERSMPLLDAARRAAASPAGPDLDPSAYGAEPHPELGADRARPRRFELARRAPAPTRAGCRSSASAAAASRSTSRAAARCTSTCPTSSTARSRTARRAGPRRDARGARRAGLAACARRSAASSSTSNSFHHQAVRPARDGLRAVAWSPDGVDRGRSRTDGAALRARACSGTPRRSSTDAPHARAVRRARSRRPRREPPRGGLT